MSMLPKTLASKVIGGLTIDMYASESEVLDRSMDIIQNSVAERKKALVANLITAAHKGGGSLGLADTLMAVQEQRVQTLVIQEGYRASGKACTNCGYLTLKETKECPACSGPVRDLEDMVDHLVHRAVHMDVEVAFTEDDRLAKEGSIGTLWRF
jgi:peptide subunit release factor 1 (eRF1)